MKQFLILCLISHLLFSETFIFQEGKSYDFAEKNAIADIQEHIKKNEVNIEANIAKSKIEQEKKARVWKPEQRTLTVATKNKVFYPDMTYTVPEDIKDATGRIMYAKGFKFNPADYVQMQQEIVIIDATNKIELEWAKNNNYLDSAKYMLLLSDGNALDIADEFKKPVYYLTKEIADKFQIKKTPTIIKQVGNKIKVSEICLKNCQ
ncbi:MAG: chromosome segregation protein ParM [Sulfurimonas sp.]|nr:chromosome segregation protein ParM [Sulfurimonas sp.]